MTGKHIRADRCGARTYSESIIKRAAIHETASQVPRVSDEQNCPFSNLRRISSHLKGYDWNADEPCTGMQIS